MVEVLKFGATWCQPCKTLSTIVEKLKPEFPNITFVDVDVEKHNELARHHRVTAVPTMICGDRRMNGAMGESLIRRWLKEVSNG